MKFVFTKEIRDWKGWTLAMPTVSVGNVDQLAVSLLVENTASLMVGFAVSEHLPPMVGYQSDQIVTSINVYECEEKRLVILQQRATLIRKKYIDELVEWIKEMGFREVVLLAGVIACERTDQQLTGNQCRFLLSKSLECRKNDLFKILPELEKRKVQNNEIGVERNLGMVDDPENNLPFIPGSGMANKILANFEKHKIDSILLMRFSYEGENASDAVDLASMANKAFNWTTMLSDNKWKRPDSWTHLYGNSFDQAIFQ